MNVRKAIFSPCGLYRYTLDFELPDLFAAGPPRSIVVIMLNPSTADATHDDPTIRRVIGFARREGIARVGVRNLFAWRATDPANLCTTADPIGPDNDVAIRMAVAGSNGVLCAWGATYVPGIAQRVAAVKGMLAGMVAVCPKPISCLGLTRSGEPRHPLYVHRAAPFVPFAVTP